MEQHTIPLLLATKNDRFESVLTFSHNPFSKLLAGRHQYLHEHELRYFNRLPAEARQYSYLHGRYAAKKALGVYFNTTAFSEIEIRHGIFHQPIVHYTVAGHALVSIAHSGEWSAAFAFPESLAAGIDMELIDPLRNWDDLIPLSSREKILGILPGYQDNEVQTLFWTIKEALSKAIRLGFTVDMKLYELAACQQINGYLESTFTCFTQFKAYSWCAGGYAWSLVLPTAVITDNNLLPKLIAATAVVKW